MRKRTWLVIAVMVLAGLLVAAPAFAKKQQKGPRAGRSNIGHLNLDPAGPEPNAGGKIKYNMSGETLDFVFNGHRLTAGAEYSLVSNGIVLDTATANGGGNVHMEASGVDGSTLEGGNFTLVRTADAAVVLTSAPHEFDYTGAPPVPPPAP